MGWLSKKWKQIKGWFTPSEPKPQGVNVEKKGTNQGVPIIYGFVKKAPCIKVFKVTTDKTGGAINEYLHFICVFCVGEIEEIGQLYFNDIPQSQIDSERYFIKTFVGSETQTHCTELANEFSRWQSTAKLKNVAYAYVRLKQNKKIDWWRGEPSIAADIKGLKVLDPRDSQIKYSDNLALCTYDYLTNADYGKGLAPSKTNTASFITAADFIDTERTYTRTIYQTYFDDTYYTWNRGVLGTFEETVIESLMSCNISLDPEKTLKKNVETLLGGMRAILPETNGQYRIAIEKDDAPVFAFTKDNIVGAIQCQGGSQSDRYNQVIIRFRNKLTGEDDEAVFPSDDALHQQWKTEDSGKLLLGEFDFDTINNKAEALQMGHVIAYRSRDLIGALFSGLPETLVVEAGDVVTLDSQILGWNAKPFRIESVDIDLTTGEIAFQAVEHQNTIYPWAINEVVEEFSDTSFALPQSIKAPTNLGYTTSSNEPRQGYFSWDDPNDVMVTSWVFELLSASQTIVFSAITQVPFLDISTINIGNYTAKVSAKNTLYQSDAISLNVAITNAPTLSGSDKTNYSDIRIDNAVAVQTSKEYIDGDFVVNLPNVVNDLNLSNFTIEVKALLDQVNDITGTDTLPIVLDNMLLDIQNTENAISNVRLDETSIAALQATYQQLGLDLISSQGDTNSAFTSMVEKLVDTDQFVADINEQLGTLLVEGGKVSYDQFITYQLLVDTLNGSLTSIINQVNHANDGLSAAHSKIDQNINDIGLLLGNTEITELLTKTTQVSLNLNRLENTLTEQSFAVQFDEWAQFQQTLSGELQLSNLLESNIDFALAQDKLTSDIDEVKAEASSTKTLVAAFNDDLNKATSSLASNENVLATAKRSEASVTKQLRSELSDETISRKSAITAVQQTVTDEENTRAQEITALNSTIDDAETGLAKAHSEIVATKQTVTDEATTRAQAITNINSTINDPVSGLAKAHSEIVATNQTAVNEAQNTANAFSAIESRVTDEEAASADAVLVLNSHTDSINGLTAKVFLGLDVNGRVTGIYINGSTNQTKIEFSADQVSFVDPTTGDEVIGYDLANNRSVFNGVLAAENIIGEQASGAGTVLSNLTLTATYQTCVSFTIPAVAWQRTILIPCPFFNMAAGNTQGKITVQFKVGTTNIYQDGLVRGTWDAGYFSAAPRSYVLGAGASATFTILAKLNTGSDAVSMFGQGYNVSVFKASSAISFN